MSAKGSLKQARDPRFQALFAIRGVSANVFKMTLDQIVGPKGNKEFTDLITVMGCNAGVKFDMSKLNYDKIIIASDADVDGYFIRSLLLAFFFKLYPDIIKDGRLFIAEPPLYRVDDKKDPFVINKKEYIERYVQAALKDYKLGYQMTEDENSIEYLSKSQLTEFLGQTTNYVDDIRLLVEHYKTNDRLLEIILEECALMKFEFHKDIESQIKSINIQHLMDRIGIEFPELYYDDNTKLIKGSINAKLQVFEISVDFIKRSKELIQILTEWMPGENGYLILRNNKTGMENKLSVLGTLKMLKKYQPNVLHRFKGLGENDEADIRTTIMDPNTRSLVRVNLGDIENDMKIFQMLRGGNPADVLARRSLIREFVVDRDTIDT